MKPVDFEEANMLLIAPEGAEQDVKECKAFQDVATNTIVTCWELTDEDIENIKKTKRLWLSVLGFPPPPICMETRRPFIDIEKLEVKEEDIVDSGD